MLLRVILTVMLLAVCAALVWPRPGRRGRDDRFPSGVQPPPGSWPETPEGLLVRRLWAGEMTPAQYQQAMSRLAAHHPLETPHD